MGGGLSFVLDRQSSSGIPRIKKQFRQSFAQEFQLIATLEAFLLSDNSLRLPFTVFTTLYFP